MTNTAWEGDTVNQTMLTATILAWLTLPTLAQEKTHDAGPPPAKIGLIDMAYIFKNYKKFEVLRDDLKVRLGEKDGQAKLMAARVRGLKSDLEQLTKGSREYADLEKQIVNEARKLEDFGNDLKRRFIQEEAQFYRTVYLETVDAVKEYAESHKYTLIIRFNREGIEKTTDPQKILQKMNQLVVHFRPEDDITDAIVKSLNEKYQQVTRKSEALPDAPIAAGKPGTGRGKIPEAEKANPG